MTLCEQGVGTFVDTMAMRGEVGDVFVDVGKT